MLKLLFVLILSTHIFALSLESVQAELQKKFVPTDSAEIKIRSEMNILGSIQKVEIYRVQKGSSKIFLEMKMPFLKQRSIINGKRMKVIDLNSLNVQIVPYKGELLDILKQTQINPLDFGEWKNPQKFQGDIYIIENKENGSKIYYHSSKKRIEKIETMTSESFAITHFLYNAEGTLKEMQTEITNENVTSEIKTEVLIMRSSKDFPDKLFDF